MKYSGSADLPLHYGHVPQWLAERMGRLGLGIVEALIADYGQTGVLSRLSDPFWFQSLGAVMGMDWHSSGITTSVMGALKRVINPRSADLGIYICGGKGRHSRAAPEELLCFGDRTGIDAGELIRCSRLSAKVDNTAVQDGYQVYMHNFIVSDEGQWTVIQQGMNGADGSARRYHWHSANLRSFVEDPHTGITGSNQGHILNLVAKEASDTRQSVMSIVSQPPEKILSEARKLVMPSAHEVRAKDVDLKRLGSVLWLAHEKRPSDFAGLLLLEGLGPRTLQSLALVSEVIHGTPSRFKDPARFSFAHGGKDGAPFPVPLKIYDETIATIQSAVEKARIGQPEKKDAIRKLSEIARRAEQNFIPNANFDKVVEKERRESWRYGGRTVNGDARPPKQNGQLTLF